MSTLTAIDSGACSGVADFYGVELLSCRAAAPADVLSFGERVVIERPRIYPGRRQKAKPEDIITLAITVGEIKREALRAGAREVLLVEPHEWKGQVPKKIHHKRVLAELTAFERARIPKLAPSVLHNVLDAIGIGLWALGRMPR